MTLLRQAAGADSAASSPHTAFMRKRSRASSSCSAVSIAPSGWSARRRQRLAIGAAQRVHQHDAVARSPGHHPDSAVRQPHQRAGREGAEVLGEQRRIVAGFGAQLAQPQRRRYRPSVVACRDAGTLAVGQHDQFGALARVHARPCPFVATQRRFVLKTFDLAHHAWVHRQRGGGDGQHLERRLAHRARQHAGEDRGVAAMAHRVTAGDLVPAGRWRWRRQARAAAAATSCATRRKARPASLYADKPASGSPPDCWPGSGLLSTGARAQGAVVIQSLASRSNASRKVSSCFAKQNRTMPDSVASL
ncbi:MAG: hypothetical protein JWM47_4180 [Acidimicrobiales bacterium]|nr:hypothetical protein [Acidimicrobiales bacterium]